MPHLEKFLVYRQLQCGSFCHLLIQGLQHGAQRAEINEKVHKSPLEINVIDFELNGFNAYIWVPWSSSDTKKL